MFGRQEYREIYRIPEEQYEEMKSFYEKLGYSKKQVKRLCSSCFGYPIKVDKDAPVYYDWSVYPKREYKPTKTRAKSAEPLEDGCLMLDQEVCMPTPPGGAMMGMQMNSAMMSAPMMGAMPMAGMAEKSVMCAMPMAKAPEAPAFNTAETNDAPENEKHSPMDSSQLIFSANVNTASWSYLRNKISAGDRIDKSFIRIEEILNSYKYKLQKPVNDELFAVSAEMTSCPWDQEAELLFLGFKGKKADKKVKQNLTLLVDVSGSMTDEWLLVQMSMAAIISKLKAGDYISVIAYSDETETVAKNIECGDLDRCIDALMKIKGIGGCTNGSEGLENAYQYLKEHFDKEANNRVFIFTDGDFNFGITGQGGLKDFIYQKRETGIYLSIVGYGSRNFKDNKMETLAQNGNGNYTFVANPYDILDSLWKKLIANLVTVAKDVKISVELNPALVSEYRLIGYDARMLTQQEFHDTKKAADGIGSGHNVVAVIELKRGKAEKQYSSRYLNVSAVDHQDELAFIEVHYKSPEDENLVMTKSITVDSLEKAGHDNAETAALLAAFGLLVKDSDYKGTMNKQALSELVTEYLRRNEISKPKRYSHFDIIRQYLS